MEHVVFFPAHDGTPAFRRVSSLEDAVRLVEHLRNVENVNEVSVHALAEVQLAFKTWYRVEVPAAAAEDEAPAEPPAMDVPQVESSPSSVPHLTAVQVEAPVLEATEQPVAAMAAAGGQPPQASGPSSLGFFSS